MRALIAVDMGPGVSFAVGPFFLPAAEDEAPNCRRIRIFRRLGRDNSLPNLPGNTHRHGKCMLPSAPGRPCLRGVSRGRSAFRQGTEMDELLINRTFNARTIALMLVGVLGLAIGAGQAYADIVIDNFTGSDPPTVSSSIGAPAAFYPALTPYGWGITIGSNLGTPSPINTTVAETTGVIPGVISGWSRSTNIAASGVFAASQIGVGIAGGVLGINTGPATNTTLTYSGPAQNLTGLTGFSVNFLTLENAPATIVVTVEDSSNNTKTASVSDSTAGLLNIGIGSFTGSPGLNLGAITEVQVEIEGIANADFAVNGITADLSSVPEPSSLAIWALLGASGGLGVCICRSRRSTAAA